MPRGVDESPYFSGRGVVEEYSGLLAFDFFIGIVLGLVFQQRHTVPQLDHAPSSALCRLEYLPGSCGCFPGNRSAVHQRIGKLPDRGRPRWNDPHPQFLLPVISGDLAVIFRTATPPAVLPMVARVRLTGGRGGRTARTPSSSRPAPCRGGR